VGLTAAVLVAGLWLDPADVDVTTATRARFAPPSWDAPLGADNAGRSVLALTLYGARTSLGIGLAAAALALLFGATVGVAAGHLGGRAGGLLTRLTEWFVVLPTLPVAVTVAAVLGRGPAAIVVAIAVTSWATVARLLQAQVRAVGHAGYVERAAALGGGRWHRLRVHELPAVAPLIAAAGALTAASAIGAEATLSFLGLGDPHTVSWGAVLRDAATDGAVSAQAWWCLLGPGSALCLAVIALHRCADLLRRP
jgi:peptide/nickel transport system permease protein